MKVIDRLYEYFELNNIKPTAFEKELGLSNGYLGTQKKRNADVGESIILKIIDYCRDLSVEWLLTGHGQMLRDEQPVQEMKPVVIYKSDPKDADLITAKNSIIALQEDKIRRLESLLMQHSTVLDIARSADLPSQQTEGTKPHKKHD